MSVLERLASASLYEEGTPESYVKGEEFVEYVRNQLFPRHRYKLLDKTPSYQANRGDFIESTKNPDLKLQSKESGKVFFVEAKYRSDYFDDKVGWCKPHQLRRYKEIDENTPVYVVIGLGHQPDNPLQAFLMPVRAMKYTKLFRSVLKEYEVPTNNAVDEGLLK